MTTATERQHRALIALGAHPDDVQKVAARIQVIERRNHSKACAYCNEPQTESWLARWNAQKEKDLAEIARMLPKTTGLLFINQDPRGYALKIDNEKPGARDVIHAARVATDWGGYGLLQRSAYQ